MSADHPMRPDPLFPPVTRWLRWFDPQDGRLLGEAPLTRLSVEELRALFGVPAEDPMFDCFPVQPPQVERLQCEVAEAIRLKSFAYFVEADAVLD